MRIFFILDYSFPSPTAPSSLIGSLARALSCNGDEVSMLCALGTYRSIEDAEEKIDWANVIYGSGKFRHKNIFIRNYNRAVGYFKTFLIVYKEHKIKKIDLVFLPIKPSFYNTLMYLFLKILKVKIAQQRTEYPEIYLGTIYSKINYYYYKYVFLKLLDGMIVITDTLKSYYEKFISKKAIIKTVPVSVDIERFKKNNNKSIQKKYIAYCGTVSKEKDGVDVLIKSFAKISHKYKDFDLYIIGGSPDKNLLLELKEMSESLGIKDRVVFTGRVQRDKMPDFLNNASVLTLSRPSSLQAEGGFPTKLGEYLATKNPVVVTDVGEITKYLKDGHSAYIADPNSVDSFANKLDECLNDPKRAENIGREGFKVAFDNFYYVSQIPLIVDFITKICGKNNEN